MSKLTLDETIKHCLEMASENEKCAKHSPRMDYYDEITSAEEYYQRAAEQRQIAEWLTELKWAKAELNRLYPILEYARKLTNEIFEIRKKWQEMK